MKTMGRKERANAKKRKINSKVKNEIIHGKLTIHSFHHSLNKCVECCYELRVTLETLKHIIAVNSQNNPMS